jgi:glycosyltransferase involved in cell wall biosynthesis
MIEYVISDITNALSSSFVAHKNKLCKNNLGTPVPQQMLQRPSEEDVILLFKSPLNTISGYGKIIDVFIRNFLLRGVDLYILPTDTNVVGKYASLIRSVGRDLLLSTDEFVVCPLSLDFQLKNHLLNSNLKRKKFIYTMWESSQLDAMVVNRFNHPNNRILVPSNWNRINFLQSGTTSPIYVVPLGINPNTFFYRPPHTESKMVFGCGEAQNQTRKRLEYTIECFCKAFNPKIKDVELRVKIDIKQYSSFPRYADSRIKIIFDDYTEEKMADYYASLDVFVSLSYSEGWGLMQHEAMMCGRPVMAANYGGITEFFDEHVGIPIDYEEELALGMYGPTEGFWAKVNEKSVVENFRYCYNNKSKIIEKGLLSNKKVSHLTEENTVDNLLRIIKSQKL